MIESCHFTYHHPDPSQSQLFQGDILKKTDGLHTILKDIHPHYVKEDYKYLIVLTQSCDLVRRERTSKCKAQYITLAAVRSFELVIEREVSKYQDDIAKKGKFVLEEKKELLKNFLVKLLNNNNHEYFFLYSDQTLNFPDPCVAFLRLSIPIKADLHYEECLRAKLFELKNDFRAKLGWLVGHIYSRVATDDWVPWNRTKEEFESMIEGFLNDYCIWIPKDKYKELCKKAREIPEEERSLEVLHKIAREIKILTKKEQVLSQLNKIFAESGCLPDDQSIKKLLDQIRNDSLLSAILS